MTRTIAIIGAGFGGLSTAKVFREFGFDVTVYEKDSEVGGVWSTSRRYPGLTTQNVRSTYALTDYPYPKGYPEWPSGQQVQEYLEGYVDHFNLRDCIHLNTEVTHASLDEQAGSWTVDDRGPRICMDVQTPRSIRSAVSQALRRTPVTDLAALAPFARHRRTAGTRTDVRPGIRRLKAYECEE